MNDIFAKKIRNLRISAKLPREQLAQTLEVVTVNMLTNLELGRSKPTSEQLKLLSEYFGISINSLMDDQPVENQTAIETKLQHTDRFKIDAQHALHLISHHELGPDNAQNSQFTLLPVRDNLMEPTLKMGDTAIVKYSATCPDNYICAFTTPAAESNDQTQIGRVITQNELTISLKLDDPETLLVTKQRSEIEILGIVVGKINLFKQKPACRKLSRHNH